LKLDGYIRVSRVNGRGGENFISPRVQRDKIQTFAKLHGHKVVAWHEDLDEPGSKSSRSGFQAAIERVETGKTDGIAVAKLDRFARSVADAAGAIRRIRDAGGELLSVEDNFDSSTPMGKFAMHMLLALGELELDRIRENWSTAQRLAVERGVHVASRAPTGYKRGDGGRLELVKKDAAAVAEAFRRRSGGASLSELAQLFMERKVRGPYDNSYWTVAAVSKLLQNPVYLGEARSGRYRKKDAHPAIVSKKEWQSAQSTHSLSPLKSSDGALLSGLLRCAGCRYVLKPDTMTDRDGSKIRIYRCRGEHAAGRCPERAAVLGRLIEPYIEEQFLGSLVPGGMLARGAAERRELEDLRRQLERAEAELEAWVNEPALNALGRELYLAGLESRQQTVDTLHAQIAELASEDELDALSSEVDIRAFWGTLTIPERRRLLALGIDAIMLRPGRTLDRRTWIFWRGQGPDGFPSRGRRLPLASFAWPDDRPDEAGEALAEDGKKPVLDGKTRSSRRRPKAQLSRPPPASARPARLAASRSALPRRCESAIG
jgi:site-specific DNA recombinase